MSAEPPAREKTARSTGRAAKTALETTRAVLGAGTLLVPAALAPAQTVSLALAAVLFAWCLLLTAAGGTRTAGPTSFVERRLGPRAARAVQTLYFAGFATGQAAIASAAGEFAADGTTAHIVAAAVLTVAAALTQLQMPPWALRFRLAAVLALTAAWWQGLLALDGGTAAALPVLLFAWVGLEYAVPAPDPTPGSIVLRTLGALVVPAALYAVLLSRTPPTTMEQPALGWAAAGVLGTYCLTNLRSAGARLPAIRTCGGATTTGGRQDVERRGALLAAGLALTVLALATAGGWSAADLLLGPGVATAAIYLLLALAAARSRTTRRHRRKLPNREGNSPP